jgi:hypothetical protein
MSSTEPTPRLNVFLSYCTGEARYADSIKQRLERDFIGLVAVFLATDTTSIPTGSRWHADIINALQRSQLHLVVCSSESVQRPWINYEAGAAAVREIPIVPLCHSGLIPDQLPVPLSESQGALLTDANALRGLYTRIASMIGSSIPEIDFESYAKTFQETEQEMAKLVATRNIANKQGNRQPELIQNPHVLCVTSSQFREMGYANQLQVVLDAFPENIQHQVVMNSGELRKILLEEKVDIIHIAAFVCPRGGDLYFSPVELPLGKSTTQEVDSIKPSELTALLREANTRLVVLGGSASLVLAAQIIAVANVISAGDMVSAKAMASWVETFYKKLTQEPLAAANELACEVSQAPMKLLYAQRPEPPSMTVQFASN